MCSNQVVMDFYAIFHGFNMLELAMPWHLSTGRLPLSVDAIHGDRSQRDREAALHHFRAGATQVQPPDAPDLGKL